MNTCSNAPYFHAQPCNCYINKVPIKNDDSFILEFIAPFALTQLEYQKLKSFESDPELFNRNIISLKYGKQDNYTEKQILDVKNEFFNATNSNTGIYKFGVGGRSDIYALNKYPDIIVKNKYLSDNYPETVDKLRHLAKPFPLLLIPQMSVLIGKTYFMEEKLPIPKSKHEIVMTYIKSKNNFTPAIRQLTELYCKGVDIGDLTPGQEYGYKGLMRYDNLTPLSFVDPDGVNHFELALIDLDRLQISEASEITTSVVSDLVRLFPYQYDDIIDLVEENRNLTLNEKNNLKKQSNDSLILLDNYFIKYEAFLEGKNEKFSDNHAIIEILQEHQDDFQSLPIEIKEHITYILNEINSDLKHRCFSVGTTDLELAQLVKKYLFNGKITINDEEAYNEALLKVRNESVKFLHEKNYIYVRSNTDFSNRDELDVWF